MYSELFSLVRFFRHLYLRSVEQGGSRHQEHLRVCGLCWRAGGRFKLVGRSAEQRAELAGQLIQYRILTGGCGQGASLFSPEFVTRLDGFFNTENTPQVVDDQSVVLEWKLFPSRETLSSGEDQQASQLYLPQWISATVHINNPQISYTTKVIVPTLFL